MGTYEELISVIIPVYNVSAYLEKCVESVLRQTYKNLDILLIDDGSEDDSGEKCEDFSRLDRRIRYFKRKNAGVGETRNFGITHAAGNYIAFVDSDDWVDHCFLEVLYSTIKQYDADIAVCGVTYYYEKEDRCAVKKQQQSFGVVTGETKKDYLVMEPAYFCNKLFKRELFSDEVKFPACFYEDTALFPVVLINAEKIINRKDCLYYYLKDRSGSTTNMLARAADMAVSIEYTLSYYERHGLIEEYREALTKYFLSRLKRFYWQCDTMQVAEMKRTLENKYNGVLNRYFRHWREELALGFLLFGSFNMRWSVYRVTCSYKSIDRHICYSSLISQMMGNKMECSLTGSSPFRQMMLAADMEQELGLVLGRGVLILDFLEERFDLLETAEGCFVTDTEIYRESGNNTLAVTRRIRNGSMEYMELWRRACDRFIELLSACMGNRKVILLKMRLAHEYRKDKISGVFCAGKDTDRKNTMIEEMEQYFLSHFTKAVYLKSEEAFVTDADDSKGYGCSREYLNVRIYRDYAEQLRQELLGGEE
ncbi:glycosyltransferase [Hungatella hathewayi]|uniref:glycosyltransferase n=1 Tax=Hungatella hathewayi TaxID=154046 RepID=UPI003565FF96